MHLDQKSHFLVPDLGSESGTFLPWHVEGEKAYFLNLREKKSTFFPIGVTFLVKKHTKLDMYHVHTLGTFIFPLEFTSFLKEISSKLSISFKNSVNSAGKKVPLSSLGT